MRVRALLLATLAGCLASLATAQGAANYFLDSQSGDDGHDGLSQAHAWKTLDRLNRQTFQPGDHIWLKANTRYQGQLRPMGSGSALAPICLAAYGQGPRPRIDGQGAYLDAVLLRNIEYWEVHDLEVTNLGPRPQPWQTGVRILSDGFGAMHHIHLQNLFVHDVNGDLRKDHEGCGIFFESKGANASHFEDLLIEHCRVLHVDRNGICQRASNDARSLHVVIRLNLLEDIGGDGIKLWGSNGGLVENNVLRGGRTRAQDPAAGIWPWDCDDTLIQGNEVSGMQGTLDGQGFDSDYRCRRSTFQYNYSHDNAGGFMLICSPGNSYCEDTVIRYNISQNDGLDSSSNFHFGGKSTNTWIYNNDIYIAAARNLPLLLFTTWDGGNAADVYFCNNIFYVDGQVSYQWGNSRNVIFENNAFYGRQRGVPHDPAAVTLRPPLANPGGGGNGVQSLSGYKWAGLAEYPPGKIIPGNGGRDFFGNLLPVTNPPSLGAFQP
jgi:hypothetical protein